MSYPAYTHRQAAADPERLAASHSPARLRAAAHLYGVETVPLERARVLAIGCGDGSGLLPFALAYPQAQAVGIDTSEELIKQGAAAAQCLGAANLALYVGQAADAGTQLGRFDYVIVTGLYSYLPAEAQQALLQTCSQLLSPQGILYVDCHVYPGAKSFEVVRDAIMLHGHAAQNDTELRQSAIAALSLFREGMAAVNPHSATLAAAAAQFERALRDPAAGADALSCNPSYFVELAGVAAQAGLAYLGDAQPLSELPLSFGQAVSLNHSLLAMGQPATVRQQYLDFATGRSFRQSLWFAQERAAEGLGRPDLSRLQDLRFATGLIRLAAQGQEQGATYVNHLGRALITQDADVVTVVDTLAHAWPASIPYGTLLAVLLHKNEAAEEANRKALDRALQTLLENDLAHYCLDRGPYEAESDAPLRLPVFLTEQQHTADDVALPRFNLWHEPVNYVPSPAQAAILAHLAAGRLPTAATAEGTPADPAEIGETLSLLKRYALALGNTRSWAAMLRHSLDSMDGFLPLVGLYISAQATLTLNARVLSASGHQPNPGPALAARTMRMHELMTQQAYLEAEPVVRQLIKVAPRFWDAWEALAIALFSTFRSIEALRAGLTMLDLAPADSQSHIVLSAILTQMGRTSEAIGAGRRAVELGPRNAQAHSALADALAAERRYKEAQASNLTAIALDPKQRKARVNLCKTHIDSGEVSLAEQTAREVVAMFPTEAIPRSNLLFALNYSEERTAAEVYQAYRECDEQLFQPLRAKWRPHANPRHANRKLKIGYVSPDFKQHSGNNFVELVFAGHDRRAFELTAYAELAQEDEVTARFKTYFDHWVPTAKLSDADLAEKIRADGIDILIDLAGHTQGNRLGVFARKPAPVSVTWMGYGYTTGLSAIDYIIMDDSMAPVGSEPLFSEKIWRLKTSCAYRPGSGMGEVSELPALTSDAITFGSLSRAIRINHRTVRTWAAILRRLPNSRLIVNSGSYRDAPMCETLAARFAAHGVSRDRLIIGYHSPPWDVIRQIDIGLDCFPHNSGTTLVEFVYMGVPYLTLADRPSVGRLGSSILKSVGHPELICSSDEEYVEKAVALASDLPALANIRKNLRQAMRDSVLMDETGFMQEFEMGLKSMFTQWCEQQA
ncbi:methyltransferase domain-containing protein [Achromobacter xylosoxidans]